MRNKINFYKVIIISILVFSCNKKENLKELNFQRFTITLPANWEKVKIKGIDSEINLVITPNNDSVFFDFGEYSEKFNETNKVFSRKQILKYNSLRMDTKNLYFSDTPEIDQAQGTFLKEYYYYDTIDNKIAKIKIPKKPKIGITGIHFNLGKNNLTISAKRLDLDNQAILVDAFKTIKFK